MANIATIEPTKAQIAGEGAALVLEMENLKDIKFMNKQLVEFGIRNLKRVNQYLEILDGVMASTDDERIIVAGASVAVNALKAVVAALKADLGSGAMVVNNTQNNVGDAAVLAQALRGMTPEQLRALAGDAE